jgi:hypothetical protein
MLDLTTGEVGAVQVHTTHNRGHSAEELTEMALNKIILIGGDAPEPIRSQAEAYRGRLRNIILFYMRQAMLSERATFRAELTEELYGR